MDLFGKTVKCLIKGTAVEECALRPHQQYHGSTYDEAKVSPASIHLSRALA